MNDEFLKFDVAGAIGTITLNRPEKRNALSLELLEALRDLLTSIGQKDDVRVVIIKGEGKVFSAGHDISQLVNREMTDYKTIFDTCIEVMEKIQRLPQPVIAQVHGVATAAGCQLVAACDLAVAEEGTLFGTPGVKIGLFCTTPGVPLVRAIGRKRALEMLLTGRMISAREAEQYGLINKVVPADQLAAETRALAERIAEASPLTVSIGKEAFYTQVNLADFQAYDYAKQVIVTNLFAEDAKEGLSAFLEKRRPTWKGR
ncbi:MAG: enoyl-CoA hydratase [Deltaproteobacteria bacterium]|nr:enoyl-CoA hydratase [Deltaproteobacteria bacterium]MBW2073340.1 enoyl-CoA hydratase [Deltaproteobacteria bacterium]RLB83199.1 MAG: enoyl-CoA hydratase [Deltaproteobacteria bacterium]